MAKKASKAAEKQSVVEAAIAAFRLAHAEWDRAMPGPFWTITAQDANGRGFTMQYQVPGGEALRAWMSGTPSTGEAAAIGLATPKWSSLPQPILRPTNPEWQQAYDACAAARVTLAAAADELAAAVPGNANAARILRERAKVLAALLRDVPPVWPTSVEKDLAFEINNGDITDFRVEVKEAQLRQEEQEARATEERRKQKAEQLADAMIAWHTAQHKGRRGSRGEPALTKRQREKSEKLDRLRSLLTQPEWCSAKHSTLATELGVSERTLRTYMREMKAK